VKKQQRVNKLILTLAAMPKGGGVLLVVGYTGRLRVEMGCVKVKEMFWVE